MIRLISVILQMARPYRLRLALGVLCGVLTGLAEPLLFLTVVLVFKLLFPSGKDSDALEKLNKLPVFLQSLAQTVMNWAEQIQKSIPSVDGHPTAQWTMLIVSAIPVVMLLRGLVTYLNAYLMNWVAIRSISDLRERAFEHLLNLSVGFFSKNSTGELMSRINDINLLQGVISNSMVTIINEPISLVTYIVMLFTLQPTLTLWTLLIFPICVLPVAIYSRKMRKSSVAIQNQFASLSRTIQEAFSGNRVIKAYNLESVVMKNFNADIQKHIGHYMRMIRSQEIPGPLIEFIGSLGVAALLLYFAMQPNSSPGDFVKFVATIFLMYRPLKTLIRLQGLIVQARGATERIFEMMEMTSNVADPANPKPLHAKNADIHFDGIDFDYGDKPVLRNIQLKVKSGQVVALVGSSGSGKTTLTNLLLRFYDPRKNSVRINGTDIRDVSLRDLRNQIAIVTQETFLFNDTIRNNIAFGRPGATEEEIIEAARHAHAHDFIQQTPEGYNTVIGDRGDKLSGGQRQRIAIARAILKNVPILVLDEATSALDSESERAVQAALEELMKGRTTICIAHRLSTIQKADVIVVLDQGEIVEVGKHADLLAREGIYKKLHALQFQGHAESSSAN